MTAFLVGLALAGGVAVGFMVLICKLLPGRSIDVVYAEGYRNMDELRCPHCQRVKVRGAEHGVGWCVTSPLPPPPPQQPQLIEATYRRSAR